VASAGPRVGANGSASPALDTVGRLNDELVHLEGDRRKPPNHDNTRFFTDAATPGAAPRPDSIVAFVAAGCGETPAAHEEI